jgi:ABC-type polysaccharide/polyol phosphate export permease
MDMTSPAPPAETNRARRASGFDLSGRPAPLRVLVQGIWDSRELVVMLSRKEFFAKYRRASFGVLWAAVLPLIQALVLAVVLSRFVRFETGHSYAAFIYSGTLPWTFFSSSVAQGTTSIVDNSDMSSKIYFPRAVFPLTVIGAGLYGLIISLAILLGFAVLTGASLGLHTLLIIPATAILIILTSGVAALLAALDVYFRDLKFMVQAVLQPMFYVTPAFYPLSATGKLHKFIEANPATGIVQMFHDAAGTPSKLSPAVAWSVGWAAVVLVAAAWVHRRYDRVLGDLL